MSLSSGLAMVSRMKRVCLLVGGGGVLGNAICRLLRSKYDIAVVYRRKPPLAPSQLQRFVDPLDPGTSLEENENPVFAIKADLSERSQQQRVVELVSARFGRVDLLINAAVHSFWASMIDDDRLLDSAAEQFGINVILPLTLSVQVARHFWREESSDTVPLSRNVINMSSVAGCAVYPELGQSVYAASKAALNHLTRHMAIEFSRLGVRVNALAPNSFPHIVPIERVVEKIVDLDEGRETGQVVVLDGAR